MDAISTPRRLVLLGAAAALVPLRQSLAQTAAAGGDWLAMIQGHHALIARSFDKLLASDRATYLARDQLVRAIGYQLTAHSVAEENIVYPMLAMTGLTGESDKLYLDQAHAKVMNAQLELQARLKERGDWRKPATALRDAVLKHAKVDEEGRLYPELRAKLDPASNAMVTAGYQREFASVKPVMA